MIAVAILRGLMNPKERGLALVACYAVPATKLAEWMWKVTLEVRRWKS